MHFQSADRLSLQRIFALAAMFVLAGCAGEDAGEREPTAQARPDGTVRSAVLITLDTTRVDALGAYGGPSGVSPALDRLAQEGIVYEQARSVAPITLPAHASMLTGLYPPRHTARDNSLTPVPDAAWTLAERAAENGLETGAFVGAVVLAPSFGLDQGFGTYDAPAGQAGSAGARIGHFRERPGPDVAAEAVTWLRSLDDGARFFLWVHLFDPHAPYEPTPEAVTRARGNPYLGEVVLADQAVGGLVAALDKLGRLDETLIVVAGDHGEDFEQHGEPTHGVFCYDSTMRVPFIVRYPDGARAGERSREIVSLVDVYPTLVEGLALGAPGEIDGVSLYRRNVPQGRGVYLESFYGTIHYGWAPLVGWVDDGGKYLHGQPPEYFDLAADPGEERPLPADGADWSAARDAIAGVLAGEALPASGAIDRDMLERLEGLGYATAGSASGLALPDPLQPTDLPNPRDRRYEAERLRGGIKALQRGELKAAIALFEAVIEENPSNATALEFLAPALAEDQRCPDALPLLERLIELGTVRALTHVNLGRCLDALGRPDEAVVAFRRASELEATDPSVLRALVELLDRLGRDEESAEYQRRLEALGS